MEAKKNSLTPMMAQWYACKKEAKEALLLFRLGDFYEAFYEDAHILSQQLDLTLTKRQNIPMSGVPAHAAEGYIEKLVQKGFLVAIAEQIETPKQSKGLVKRKIVRTISPGTILSSSSLKEKENNFFVCIAKLGSTFGIALIDFSTGDLNTIELKDEKLLQDELFRLQPSEALISEKCYQKIAPILKDLKETLKVRINIKKEWFFDHPSCYNFLTNHFQVHNLKGFGIEETSPIVVASGTLLAHLKEDLSLSIKHIKQIQKDHIGHYMAIDRATQRNLELVESLHPKSQHVTLLNLLDKTLTPMGGRLLKNWLLHPLLSVEKIKERQEAIEKLLSEKNSAQFLCKKLAIITDLERLIMRISTGQCTPRDLMKLALSLEEISPIKKVLSSFSSSLLQKVTSNLLDPKSIIQSIKTALVDHPPLKFGEGKVIRPGYHQELDTLTLLKNDSQSWIANYQAKLRETLNIKTLRIIYSKAFGYCIEVSRLQASKMPSTFNKRQTLVNTERFISSELKAYEDKILNAQESIEEIEKTLYLEVQKKVSSHANTVKKIGQAIAILDTLLSFSKVSDTNNYCRPTLTHEDQLIIEEGRHPVIEQQITENSFTPNKTHLSKNGCQMMLITGPNMAGKSTYIRQVALITIMAQIGSFVPAKTAQIGIVDQVFSRIGASDDLSRGQSTFMVEMNETANILNNGTSKSLAILDELGRGTSTYDGISIAWSIGEALIKLGIKSLVATHYFELTKLEKEYKKVQNFHVAVKERGKEILFLHKIQKGCTDKSYGIHVARLAGLPSFVIKRSYEILGKLEKEQREKQNDHFEKEADQLALFPLIPPSQESYDQVIQAIKHLDLVHVNPFQAHLQILEWQKLLKT